MDQVRNFLIDFLSVFYEAMPFIVLGAIIAGILEELIPQQFITKVIPKNRFLAIGLSALLGIVFPMCECGIVPIMRRLLRKGLPLGCCVAYMSAGPIINGIVIWSTWEAFAPHGQKGGYEIIALRIILGYVIAVGTALVVDALHRKHGNSLLTEAARPDSGKPLALNVVEDETVQPKKSTFKRIGNITEAALHDFMDITIFLTIGAALTSMSKFVIDHSKIAEFSTARPALAILCMMGLAIVMCLCSEADAFVAAAFTDMHPTAKLAFLVLGPMLDLKLLMLFTRVFRSRLILTIVICIVVQVFVYTTALHFLWDTFGFASPASPRISATLAP